MNVDARNAVVVADATHAEHERVVGKNSRWEHLGSLIVTHGAKRQLALRAIESNDRALAKSKVTPVCQRQIIRAVHLRVHASGSNFVQQRFPHMRLELIDERHLGATVAPKLITPARGQRQAAGTATNDYDTVRRCGCRSAHRGWLPENAAVIRLSAATCDFSA